MSFANHMPGKPRYRRRFPVEVPHRVVIKLGNWGGINCPDSACFFLGLVQKEISAMSKCSFSIPFSGTPEDVFNRARSAVEKQGGVFNGDAASGEFGINVFGNIRGTYSVSGHQLNIVIEDKPMMISCGMIENALKSQIG